MGTVAFVQTRSPILAILRFLVVMSFRFFLGKPMNGKRIDNSTFLKGATRGKPGKTLTRWQKKAHIHRALIRSAVFWPTLTLLVGLIIDRGTALFALALASPFLLYMAYRRGRLVFFQPYSSLDAVTGRKTQHWRMRPKYRNLFHRKPVPGLLTKKNRIDPSLPEAVQKALLAEINGGEFKGEMPATSVRQVTRRDRRKLAAE